MFNVNGVTVCFFHEPHVSGVAFVDAKGDTVSRIKVKGVTSCFIDLVDDGDKYMTIGGGSAFCGLSDNFEKAIGRKIALTRALDSLDFPKELRKAIWETYWDMVKK